MISARILWNDSDSALPKADEKLRLILLVVYTWKGWFQLAFKIEEQLDFLFPFKVQKIDFFFFLWFNISKVNCLPSFSALLTVLYLNQRAKRGKKSGEISAVL